MPILKGIKVDEFEDVTIIIFKDVSTRQKKVGDGVHIVISEAEKTKSEVMVELSETESLAWSDTTHNIDAIFDFPNKKSLEQLINYLTEIKEEYYE